MNNGPWASFCISTYKRPEFLRQQIGLLRKQRFSNFEIVISDNDPEASAKAVTEEFQDGRICYFHNHDNLGMIKSFNQSILRSHGSFIVMVTDDDPIEPDLLEEMNAFTIKYPGYGLYGGFERNGPHGNIEIIKPDIFLKEILDPRKTPWMLWSSCLIRREVLLEIGGIPDYGSPHLADHAMIVMAGSISGGLIVNKKYSFLTSHDSNFSKTNFEYYLKGCEGFFNCLSNFCKIKSLNPGGLNAIKTHLKHWFIVNTFTLKRHYTLKKPDDAMLGLVNDFARDILKFPFMKDVRLKYAEKDLIFKLKNFFGLLK